MSNAGHTYDSSDIHHVEKCELCQEQLKQIEAQDKQQKESA